MQLKNQVVGKCPLLATDPSSGHLCDCIPSHVNMNQTLYDVVNSSPSSRSREARTRMRPSCDVHLRGDGVPVKLTELANIT